MSKVQLIVAFVSLFALVYGGGDSLDGGLKPDERLLSLLGGLLGTGGGSDFQRPPDCRYISVLNILRSKLSYFQFLYF